MIQLDGGGIQACGDPYPWQPFIPYTPPYTTGTITLGAIYATSADIDALRKEIAELRALIERRINPPGVLVIDGVEYAPKLNSGGQAS